MRFRNLQRRRLLLFVCAVFAVYISGRLIITSHHPLIENQLRTNIRDFTGGRFSLQSNTLTSFRSPRRWVFNVSCSAIIAGDKNETKKAKTIMENYTRSAMSDEDLVNFLSDCDEYKRIRGYLHSVTEEERYFPIAFSILLHKEVEQTERLLRVIYRPHNLYCIHVDADSPTATHKAVDKLAACFDNVFIVSRKEYIVYAGFTRLQADLNCMHDILKEKSWKYFINLPSQNFPIKSNLEMVKILRIYNGSNDIEGITGKKMVSSRYEFRFKYKHVSTQPKLRLYKTNEKKNDPLPYNISIVKGSAYGVFSRGFVEFVEENRIARELLDWCRDVYSPDEYYWATLHHNPQIGTPGAYKEICKSCILIDLQIATDSLFLISRKWSVCNLYTVSNANNTAPPMEICPGKADDKPFLSVYANWGTNHCAGKMVRGVCVFGVEDLQHLVHRKELFVNKFYQQFQPLALDCMEEWMYNKTATNHDFNTSYYETLPFVRGP